MDLHGGRARLPQDQDARWLRRKSSFAVSGDLPVVRLVDLYSGCGGMSVGAAEACRRAGKRLEVVLAADCDQAARDVYALNFPTARVRADDLGELFHRPYSSPLSSSERKVLAECGSQQIVVAGPPCQGHSDLNNRTRRNDPKNALYLTVARAAEVLAPKVVVIENVPPVQWDKGNVVEATQNVLDKLGYQTASGVVNAADLGVPQRRKRFILLATAIDGLDPVEVLSSLLVPHPHPRSVRWAIGDLEVVKRPSSLDTPSSFSAENAKRMDVLFNRDLFNLPNEYRPPCHRDKDHSYQSVYGRLRWEKPAQTITTGFTSMGQGRYVHPSKRRTLTPHEAARLQTFPDYFDWGQTRRTDLSRLIGNAVPPLLMRRILEPVIRSLDS